MDGQVKVNECLTAAQLRAARAWLHWTKEDLGERAGVSAKSIDRFERGKTLPHARTLRKLRSALEAPGIVFQFEGTNVKGIGIR